MAQNKYPIAIILIAIFFTITTCTTDNSITGNSDKTLSKTTGIVDINSPTSGNPVYYYQEGLVFCVIDWLVEDPTYFNHGEEGSPNPGGRVFSISDANNTYDFRDNYLYNSEKGTVYNNIYYKLSKYGIENNLVNKYYKEHYELLKNSIEIAYTLQYGSNTDKI